ncbi:methyltransferase domain-containing protein [Nocardia sp. SYP-A9097]|uniref:class I SAM-dependent methyltransferase n=1 Tax=Nocardia sp. SYP-A9097 TaxID=2663237 RepID=UPI00129B61A5|nr:class I SAM-dependent methyltransferase [Nocardia sp. SYP-A9097]MRH90046.1 methyltransferase domain-containing protein [Nocardia sp. SYP-A9097]
MGIYENQVLPRIVDLSCGASMLDPVRELTCEGLHGRVVEIGFGSGRNVPFYPGAVDSVTAVEPVDTGWRMASKRLAAAKVPVERAGLDGQSLPFADNSFDSALSTWTLCTIPDAQAALAELRRVLVPGGTFHFVEHGLAPDAGVQKWQHRLNPVQRKLFGGCNLNRDIRAMIEEAGFEIREVDCFYEHKLPKFIGALSRGVAISA